MPEIRVGEQNLVQWIRELIEEDRLYKFYKSRAWKKLRTDVLEEYHNECAWCKAAGIITAAETVHHVQHVKKYPALALSKYYTYKAKRYKNLIPLCHDCHDKAHKRMQYKPKPKPLTEERW